MFLGVELQVAGLGSSGPRVLNDLDWMDWSGESVSSKWNMTWKWNMAWKMVFLYLGLNIILSCAEFLEGGS